MQLSYQPHLPYIHWKHNFYLLEEIINFTEKDKDEVLDSFKEVSHVTMPISEFEERIANNELVTSPFVGKIPRHEFIILVPDCSKVRSFLGIVVENFVD